MLQNNAVVLEDSGEGYAPGVTTSSKICGENKLEPLLGKLRQILACHMITTVLDGADAARSLQPGTRLCGAEVFSELEI